MQLFAAALPLLGLSQSLGRLARGLTDALLIVADSLPGLLDLGQEPIHALLILGQEAPGTLQDRLIPELRLAGVEDRAGANAYLPRYLASDNRRFMVDPTEPEPAWRRMPMRRTPLHTV